MKAGLDPVILTDIDERRLSFARNLLPNSKIFAGDITLIKEKVIHEINEEMAGEHFVLSMTPPCQGMSQNGIYTIQRSIAAGQRPPIDPRNYLVVSCIEVVARTKPSIVLFENVTEAKRSMLLIDGKSMSVLEYLTNSMTSMEYEVEISEVNFKDFGLPQSRKRVFAIFSKRELSIGPILPSLKSDPMTLRDALGHLPSLDAVDKASSESGVTFHPMHKVPVLRKALYEWVSKTPEGCSALFNNLCLDCGKMNDDMDLFCRSCDLILNKPHVFKDGKKTLIKGYDSSYRRQSWSKPARTVTTRSAYASSAGNLHPEQNRVLSVYECALLQGLNPHEIDWLEKSSGKFYPDFILRDILGEAIPASFTKIVGVGILQSLSGVRHYHEQGKQLALL